MEPTDARHFDVAVLGAGPGGYVAAIRAAQLGMRVAVIEQRYWGGVCLNVGCIPSKALLRNAELAHAYTWDAEKFGIVGTVQFDYGVAYDRSRSVAEGRVKGVHFLMRKNAIAEINGRGILVGDHRVDVVLTAGGTQSVTFDHLIIATGSTPGLFPGLSLSSRVVTYETQILSRELPESIVILGGGAIGVEFAYILANYGVRVTVIERFDRLLPREDHDVSREIARQYRKLGITILTSTRVESVNDDGRGVSVEYLDDDDQRSALRADRVLVSVGFIPRSEGFGLERLGVTLTENGAIAVDDVMRTNVPHVFAIGDVTAKLQLAHVAEAQGIVAAETIAGAETMPLGDYRMMPRVTFSNPQVASFGLTEEEAVADGRKVRAAKFPLAANGKAQGLGESSGFVKLIADARHGEILGAHMVGAEVAELLPELTLAQKWDLTSLEVARNVHAHPTIGEALQEAIHGLTGHMINV